MIVISNSKYYSNVNMTKDIQNKLWSNSSKMIKNVYASEVFRMKFLRLNDQLEMLKGRFINKKRDL